MLDETRLRRVQAKAIRVEAALVTYSRQIALRCSNLHYGVNPPIAPEELVG